MPSLMEPQVAEVAPRAGTVAARTITDEAETYNSSVAGVDIEAARAGQGVGPTHVLAAIGERFTCTESKAGLPGVDLGLSAEDPTMATLLKEQGYATAQFVNMRRLAEYAPLRPANC